MAKTASTEIVILVWQPHHDPLSLYIRLDGCYQYLNMAELLLNNQTITAQRVGGREAEIEIEREGLVRLLFMLRYNGSNKTK